MENFDYDIKKIREKYGLTQLEFADALDISREMITMMERPDDKRRPVSKATRILIDKFIEDREGAVQSERNQEQFTESKNAYKRQGYMETNLNESQHATLMLNISESVAVLKELSLRQLAVLEKRDIEEIRDEVKMIGREKLHIIEDALSTLR